MLVGNEIPPFGYGVVIVEGLRRRGHDGLRGGFQPCQRCGAGRKFRHATAIGRVLTTVITVADLGVGGNAITLI